MAEITFLPPNKCLKCAYAAKNNDDFLIGLKKNSGQLVCPKCNHYLNYFDFENLIIIDSISKCAILHIPYFRYLELLELKIDNEKFDANIAIFNALKHCFKKTKISALKPSKTGLKVTFASKTGGCTLIFTRSQLRCFDLMNQLNRVFSLKNQLLTNTP